MLKFNQADDVEKGGDVLGGFTVFESDAYEATVKALYFGKAKSGAQFAGINLLINGKEYREQVYFTTKAGDTFYVDKNTGKKRELPGFQTVNELCLITTGQPLAAQEMEEKVLKLWDSEARAETNQSVPVAVEVIGKPVVVGILKEIVNKQQKNDSTGEYEDTEEERTQNQISKFFHAETQGTVTEYEKDTKLGIFFEEWANKNKGNTINRFRKPQAAPGKPGGNGGATKSLFGNK